MNTPKKKPKKNKPSVKDKKEDRSKETIDSSAKELSSGSKKHVAEVLDSTRKIIDSIKEKLDQQEIEDSFVPVFKSIIEDPSEYAEASIDTVVNSTGSQLEIGMDFNTGADDTVSETRNAYLQNMLEFMQQNFERSQQLTIKNTKDVVDFYTKNTNLVVNINQQLAQSLNTQIKSLRDLQNESLSKYKDRVLEKSKKKDNKK